MSLINLRATKKLKEKTKGGGGFTRNLRKQILDILQNNADPEIKKDIDRCIRKNMRDYRLRLDKSELERLLKEKKDEREKSNEFKKNWIRKKIKELEIENFIHNSRQGKWLVGGVINYLKINEKAALKLINECIDIKLKKYLFSIDISVYFKAESYESADKQLSKFIKKNFKEDYIDEIRFEREEEIE